MKTKITKNQAGFAHITLILAGVVVIGALGFAGYRTFSLYRTASYQGTLIKQTCTKTDTSCTNYALKANNSKTYSLSVPSSPTVASGTPVTVTGKVTTSSSGQSTIKVNTITPSSAAQSGTTSSSSSTTTYPKDVTFTNTITTSTCPPDGDNGVPVGDVGCSISAQGLIITVRFGNAAYTGARGQVINYPTDGKTLIGRTVQVYISQESATTATLNGNSNYYVKFLD